MPDCTFTRQIPSNLCIGDSLPIINTNFANLNEGLCDVPTFVPGKGVDIRVVDSTKNFCEVSSNIVLNVADFQYFNGAVPIDLPLGNNSSLKGISLPYTENQTDPKPVVSFNIPTPNGSFPQATLIWVASGTNPLTVSALNSATSFAHLGNLGFDDSVDALYKSGDRLYVGGSFLSSGNISTPKIAIVSLSANDGKGELLPCNPFCINGNLGTNGTVRAIELSGAYFAVGGTFQSETKGKFISISNIHTGVVFPFKTNGEVNTLKFVGNYLYVGGTFSQIGYKDITTHETNGLARISIQRIIDGFPNFAIDEEFSKKTIEFFKRAIAVNSFATKDQTLYFTGNVPSKESSLASNLIVIDLTSDSIVVQPEKLKGIGLDLLVDGDYLYCAGTHGINAYYIEISNRLVSLDHVWKPKINGSVTKLTTKSFSDNYLYCHGRFTSIDDKRAVFAAALKKVQFQEMSVECWPKAPSPLEYWPCNLQIPPNIYNTSILHDGDHDLFVGGNFVKINNASRGRLAKISDFSSSQTTLLSSVFWETKGDVLSNGLNLVSENSNWSTVSAHPEQFSALTMTPVNTNQTNLKNLLPGQIINISVKRPGNTELFSDTYKKNVVLTNITLNF